MKEPNEDTSIIVKVKNGDYIIADYSDGYVNVDHAIYNWEEFLVVDLSLDLGSSFVEGFEFNKRDLFSILKDLNKMSTKDLKELAGLN